MSCDRCHGLMIEERFLDNDDCSGHPWMKGWRCMNCGLVLDRKIYERRLHAAKAQMTKGKPEKKAAKPDRDREPLAWSVATSSQGVDDDALPPLPR